MARTKGSNSFVSISLSDLNSAFGPNSKIIVSRRFLQANSVTMGENVTVLNAGSSFKPVVPIKKVKKVKEAREWVPAAKPAAKKPNVITYQYKALGGQLITETTTRPVKDLIESFKDSTTPLMYVNGFPVKNGVISKPRGHWSSNLP